MGGAWERLVRSVKEVMTAIMTDRVPTDPQLYTFLTEVERIINSRPLTHVSDDCTDLEALTPNHLLLGVHRNWEYVNDTNERDITSRKRWRQVQALADIFWYRWKREYLPELTKRTCWKDKTTNFKVDELVLLKDDDLRRGKWPLARITKLMPGDDGVVRVVQVRTKDGFYVRPVAKILKLEDNSEVPQGEGYVNDATPITS